MCYRTGKHTVLQARLPCVFQPPGNFTGWGCEGVKDQELKNSFCSRKCIIYADSWHTHERLHTHFISLFNSCYRVLYFMHCTEQLDSFPAKNFSWAVISKWSVNVEPYLQCSNFSRVFTWPCFCWLFLCFCGLWTLSCDFVHHFLLKH